jgi:hypothetical protein
MTLSGVVLILAVALLVLAAVAFCLFAILRTESGATAFWREEAHRADDARRALMAGAPVHIVNVCRECRAQLRERDRVDGRYTGV